jgi:DNA-binding MarR family transcriptional regulator
MPSNAGADEPRWLTDEQRDTWLPLVAVLLKLPAALDSQLQRDSGLSHFHYLVLAMLSESPDRTRRMSDLAMVANGSLSRLSHAVSKLEDQGWVRRHENADDGRFTDATLTDAGWDKLVSAAPGHVRAARAFVIDALTPEQVRQLRAIAVQILAAVDPNCPPAPPAPTARQRPPKAAG